MTSPTDRTRPLSLCSFFRRGITAIVFLFVASRINASTLDHIRQTKTLRCGINQETPEYSTSDDHGARQAFDADLCRAVAIAILGPNARTILTPYPDDVTSMAALGSAKVDLLPTLTLDLKHSANQQQSPSAHRCSTTA